MNHEELKAIALNRGDVKAEYDALEAEFALLHQMLAARQRAGLTQAEIAQRMGSKLPTVARLESSLGSGTYSPSLATLRKYAEAVGCHIEIKFVPNAR